MALKLIVDRENEIKAFKQEEYWTIHAQCKKQNKAFEADLVKVEGKKPKIKNEEEAKALLERCILFHRFLKSRKRNNLNFHSQHRLCSRKPVQN